MTYLPFVLLLAAVFCLWVRRDLALGMLALSVVAGYYTGALTGAAALWIALLGVIAYLQRANLPLLRINRALSCRGSHIRRPRQAFGQ